MDAEYPVSIAAEDPLDRGADCPEALCGAAACSTSEELANVLRQQQGIAPQSVVLVPLALQPEERRQLAPESGSVCFEPGERWTDRPVCLCVWVGVCVSV